ncbi:MAG: hypothetical protein JWM12_362 [Ilumatobacteraceae bacterium]|jgi:hypothetical protein|nr:hypothetical protein [Ilumatobacteraceae bacterium]
MATFRGISAIGTTVLAMLDDAWTRNPFTTDTLETSLVRADDLKGTRPFEFGVTVYVYRVAVNGTQRTTPPIVAGRRRPLPVDVDLIVTPWGKTAQRELELLGWCMRVLEDDPVLPAGLLNRGVAGVYGSNEIVELVASPLPLDEYRRLWDALPWDYQLSVAYTARVVRLESTRTITEAGPVLERDLELAALAVDG